METSAGAVIYRVEQGKRYYLLLHYEEGHWDLPKGHVEEGESLEEAMKREVREETGITQLTLKPFKERIEYVFESSGKHHHKQVFFFAGETTEKKVTLSDEHTGAVWMLFEEALAQLTFDTVKNILKDAHALP
ncbi:NUDIX domain-containing protein [Candidatus Woesearchaeota archaeon]|nr:MAG: NUDIX hydrolase [archaeon GW2011_AR4]MBS3129267.1 NUDIX domain-containing protein [Candidatus Woesearchaeota archaeon]HIH38570.1 NUDIX domain-containing protein [Candidatus Woesearchaeota archaeon]HIH48525.1 NUDIX domain-containing protein [Candidatus Woesearchaeota archaeon]HIJ02774.1 NUDIX domain-containing protein [Candidatus Woesearchaeota archaeon]